MFSEKRQVINKLTFRVGIKKPGITSGNYWVDDRVRTGDPQNHNLML